MLFEVEKYDPKFRGETKYIPRRSKTGRFRKFDPQTDHWVKILPNGSNCVVQIMRGKRCVHRSVGVHNIDSAIAIAKRLNG